MLTLNIIGAGKVGKTFGYLLSTKQCYKINDVLTRSKQTSAQACEFIKSGRPIDSYTELTPADVYLVAVTDDQITNVVNELKSKKILQPGNIVFHCSGATSSEILAELQSEGALIASLHPVKSFGNPGDNIHNFANTVCTVEGDKPACEYLTKIFNKLGAKVHPISSKNKLLYHASFVFSCNYFVSLIDVALQLLEQTGIKRTTAVEILEPLILGSWQQIKSLGTAKALTGPIARGDSELVKMQLDSVNEADQELGNLYKVLGKLTLELAVKKNTLTTKQTAELRNILKEP